VQRPADAERRQLTVLFCDLVGSTALSSSLDPEDLREVVRAYQAAAAAIIERFDGRIVQYLGDGLLVYFGYPRAHEDDARHAIGAGLRLVVDIAALDVSRWGLGQPLSVRVGVHTGVVVVGEIGTAERREHLALGETPNVAARLQGLAEPGSVVASVDSVRLVEGFFVVRTLGTPQLKGVGRPVEAFVVVSESGARTRADVAAARGITPLVDRAGERARLQGEWARAGQEGGRAVLLSGDAGIGKSRLVLALREHIGMEQHLALECQCLPYYASSALYPVADGLTRLLGLPMTGSDTERLAALTGSLAQFDLRDHEETATIARFLGVPLTDEYPPASPIPQRQKERTTQTLLSLVRQIAARRPLLFFVEDLQWADPSTLELLERLIDRGAPPNTLLILTARGEPQLPPAIAATALRLRIGRLAPEHVRTIVGRVAQGRELPDAVLAEVLAKTDGTPLFVEELTKMVLRSGMLVETAAGYDLAAPLGGLAIPTTLQDSLMARLDSVSGHKDVAQLAAVIGREFTGDLLRAAAEVGADEIRTALDALVEGELVDRRQDPDTYIFRHAMIQTTAYESMLRPKRRAHHARIAAALSEQFPEIATERPELVARHHTEAGEAELAIPFWQRAGERSVTRSANHEAVTFFRSALGLLATLPPSADRDRRELGLQTALGAPLIAVEGYAAPSVAQVYERARELCAEIGETPQLFPAIFGLLIVYLVRGELGVARDLGERLLTLTAEAGDPAYLEAHFALGTTLFYLGELERAKTVLTRGADLHDPVAHRSLANLYVFDPGTGCRRSLGPVLWLLGEPDEAVRQSEAAIDLAERQQRPYGLAAALVFAATLRQLREEIGPARELADRALLIASEHGFVFWQHWAAVVLAWARVADGSGDPPTVLTKVADSGASGTPLMRPYYLSLLADAFRRAHRPDDGIAALDEALAIVARTGERWMEAELHLLYGRLVLERDPGAMAAARQAFERSVEAARRIGARAFEDRAGQAIAALG
jgi:class 3 adenylate cyclase/tetratricopeptide (TPR) repeat protein